MVFIGQKKLRNKKPGFNFYFTYLIGVIFFIDELEIWG